VKKSLNRNVHNISLFFIITIIIWLSFTCTSYAWLVYHKPEFRGRIIDAETKAPIEGAVVVVVYYEHDIVGGPGGGNSSVIKAKETLTDKKGEFYFSTYTTLTGPNSRESYAEFIIYKPGYMSDSSPAGDRVIAEKFFSTGVIGEEGVLHSQYSTKPWKGILGIVELKKGKKDPLIPYDYRSKELPLLFKALNEERRNRGYKGELK
jgi:hypothetical protein